MFNLFKSKRKAGQVKQQVNAKRATLMLLLKDGRTITGRTYEGTVWRLMLAYDGTHWAREAIITSGRRGFFALPDTDSYINADQILSIEIQTVDYFKDIQEY